MPIPIGAVTPAPKAVEPITSGIDISSILSISTSLDCSTKF